MAEIGSSSCLDLNLDFSGVDDDDDDDDASQGEPRAEAEER